MNPYPPNQFPSPFPVPPKKKKRWPWVVGGIFGLVVVISAANAGKGSTAATSASSATATCCTFTTAAATPAVVSATTAPQPAPAADGPAKEITHRQWALIARDPDAHKGEVVVLHGYVTQADAATGQDTIRANLDGERKAQWTDYDTNTIIHGDPAVLGGAVEQDLVRVEAVIVGSYSYSTTMGGETTVPLIEAQKLKVVGQTD